MNASLNEYLVIIIKKETYTTTVSVEELIFSYVCDVLQLYVLYTGVYVLLHLTKH